MAITIKDIAREVGVSAAAVSLALNDSPMIGADTTRRVKEAAREMGYVRNQYARGLARGRSGAIALVVPDIENVFYSALVKHVAAASKAAGYDVTIAISNESAEDELRIIRRLAQQRPEAILLAPVNRAFGEGESAQRLGEFSVPLVFVSARYPGVKAPVVMCDLETGMRTLTEHILQTGARKITLLTGPEGVETLDMRCHGFISAMNAAGLEGEICRVGDVTYQNAYTHVLSAGREGLGEALICVNDMMAVGALNALSALGLRVPEDIRVAGFDDSLFSQVSVVPLTTMRQDVPLMARRAVELAVSCIENGDHSAEEYLPCRLILRRSTD